MLDPKKNAENIYYKMLDANGKKQDFNLKKHKQKKLLNKFYCRFLIPETRQEQGELSIAMCCRQAKGRGVGRILQYGDC